MCLSLSLLAAGLAAAEGRLLAHGGSRHRLSGGRKLIVGGQPVSDSSQ